ncbi:MAG TPA: 4-alpha-glucanotransferase [Chitinophagaceae bacterium]|nr:4-alpha-glucanotransferase [Chitinophagaceae bacterium]
MANDKLAAKDLQNKPLSARQPSKKKTGISVKEIKINASSDDQSKANNNKLNTNNVALKITFQLKYRTQYGQNLYITGNHPLLGNGDTNKALPLRYLNEELWSISIEIDKTVNYAINYNYILQNADGTFSYDWGSDKTFNPSTTCADEILMLDSWNYAGYYENAFYSEAFKNVLLKSGYTKAKIAEPETFTHIFKIKAPLLTKGQTVFISGNANALNDWNKEKIILMSRAEGDDFYEVKLNLGNEMFPIAYKYGVYDIQKKKIVRYEDGNNRLLYNFLTGNKITVLNDGFAFLPNNTWKGTGVAIPVFSLRSEKSFGVGEFSDLKLLVDWAKQTGLKLIQILPINDTTATHTWQDSYPYAAISAFALHPIYLDLSKMVSDENKILLEDLEDDRIRLNILDAIDYETVLNTKIKFIKQIYPSQKDKTFASSSYKKYFETNKHWLIPYAVFCYLRDQNGTSDFNQWKAYKNYKAEDIAELTSEKSEVYNDIAINYFMQYHLHLQLKEANEYAHQNGIVLKGDIAIGIYRYGADAWQQTDLFNMNVQAGAPPDDFAVKGQNWGFPTYNWHRMREDGFAWWKSRFEQMNYYFDAFRIDHILGFFRIWSIPMHAVEGIMGHFVPAIPVHLNEFNSRGIWFDYNRYTKPFINDNVLWEIFGYDQEYVKNNFLNGDGFGNYALKPEFATQRQVEEYIAGWDKNDFANKIKLGLFDLISNVILFEAEGLNGQQYHFRFAMNSTSSFKNLDGNTQDQLNELYVNYFFRRQDDFWMKEALQKLPALKRVTNMLVCGEDLGLVPSCVPDVMRQLGLLSLEIQRMPKDPKKEFFHPDDAPYLSVITPSTHDMSTIRGWWEEDKIRIQKFYNHELGQWGEAPYYCEAWINKAIVVQHLNSPAMWSIFQLQDILGTNEMLRRNNPDEERINVPSNPKHFWRYRMHLTLENLLQQKTFNDEFAGYIKTSGR